MRMPGFQFWASLVAILAALYSLGWPRSTPSNSHLQSDGTHSPIDPPHGIDEWEERDVMAFFSGCGINTTHIHAMKSLGLNGHSLMLLDNETLHSIGMAASELQHLLVEIEALRQRVRDAPLDYWEWRAVNLRFNDKWLMPLLFDPRSLLLWARLRGGGNSPLSGSVLHSHGFFSFWVAWLWNPQFALYRSIPDDTSLLGQLERFHFLILAFLNFYKIARWLCIFRADSARRQWRQIITLELIADIAPAQRRPADSCITNATLRHDAIKRFCHFLGTQIAFSGMAFSAALFNYYLVWYISLSFFLHLFFYTYAYILVPLTLVLCLYTASPFVRECLLLFESSIRYVRDTAVAAGLRRFVDSFHPTQSSKRIEVDRSNLVQSSVVALLPLQTTDFRPSRSFRIDFIGESAIDMGGVFCEWHSANCKALSEIVLLPVTNSFGEPTGLHRLNPMLHAAALNSTTVSGSANASSLWLLGCIIGLSISEKLATGISFTPAFAKCLLQQEDSLTLQDLVFELPAFEHLLVIQSNACGDKSTLKAALSDWDIHFRTSSRHAASAARAPSSDATDSEAPFSPLSRSHSASEAVTADTFDEYVKLMIRRHLVDCTSLAMSFIRDGFAKVLDSETRSSLAPQSVLAALRGDIDLGHLKRVLKFTPSGNDHTL
jgi:hypothetical protein